MRRFYLAFVIPALVLTLNARAADVEKICHSATHAEACKDGVGLWNSEKPIHERNRVTAEAIKRDGAKYCTRWDTDDEAKACETGLAAGLDADEYPY